MALCAALLLLLHLISGCDSKNAYQKERKIAPQAHDCQCKGGICYITPKNIQCLQANIHSNRVVLLDGERFTVDNQSGFIVIENVSNLTISGGESGSLIECSPHSTFGLHFKNTTNVTLTGIRIRNCGSAVPNNWSYMNKAISLPAFNETTLLIESSRNIDLSNIHIEESPGLALAVMNNENSGNPLFSKDNVNPSLTLAGCTMSHCRKGCIVIYGTRSVFIEKTVIANSSSGINTSNTDIMLKNVNIADCTSSKLLNGQVIVTKTLTFNNTTLYTNYVNFYTSESNIQFIGGNSQRGLMVANSNLTITENSSIMFTNFHLNSYSSFVLYPLTSMLQLNKSIMTFRGNSVSGGTSIFCLGYSKMDMIGKSSLVIDNNQIQTVKDAGLWLFGSSWNMAPDSNLSVTGNIAERGFFIKLLSRTVDVSGKIVLSGSVKIQNNTVRDFGVFNIFSSTVLFKGHVKAEGNHAESGVIKADTSDIHLTGTAIFSNNHAANGGAMTLSSSTLKVSSNASVDFVGNRAEGLGGAIYIPKPSSKEVLCEPNQIRVEKCSIEVLPVNDSPSNCQLPVRMDKNKAGIAGSAIYGGRLSACMHCVVTRKHFNCSNFTTFDVNDLFQHNDSSDLSSFTSDPTRVCFCENGTPNCYKVLDTISVHPGENFNLSLAIVGYGLGTVSGSVIARGNRSREGEIKQSLFGSELEYSQELRGTMCQDIGYSVVSERNREWISLAVSTLSFSQLLEDVQDVVNFQLTKNTNKTTIKKRYRFDSVFESFFHIPVFVEVDLLACPVGFQLVGGRCVCHQILLDNNIDTCFFSNGTGFILRPAPYWIGLPNDTNSSILIHPHCPFDYCQLQDISITAESVNTQCQYQRSGVLCGSCHEGLSMILGSSECKTCSNVYLVSIAIFILMGMALVTILTLLNMTVSVGTLNGLILFANILQANRTTFLPPNTSHASSLIAFLSAFIAWLNLDVGIPMCFFDGLTTYVKTWLQFVFPLYILALVGVMIIASNYSTRMTRLLGTNAVSVMATLVLLSYTKILRILITAFSFTTLTGSQDYHSVVWLADGNIKYFQLKHAILFLVALLVLLLLGVPYTVTLTAAPWIQRSRFKWVSSLYNRFKPLFDAYMGPYKDKYRYWTGMLLLARVVLIVLFSSIANTNTVAGPQLNLLLLSLSSFALFGLTAALKPYRNNILNGLEIFHLTILFIFSSSNLYVSSIDTGTGPRVYIHIVLVGICFLVFLGICVGHVWYRVRKTGTGRRPEPPEREEDGWHPLWQRARVRAEDEDEEREEVTASTAGATNIISHGGRRESLVELIADNADI